MKNYVAVGSIIDLVFCISATGCDFLLLWKYNFLYPSWKYNILVRKRAKHKAIRSLNLSKHHKKFQSFAEEGQETVHINL